MCMYEQYERLGFNEYDNCILLGKRGKAVCETECRKKQYGLVYATSVMHLQFNPNHLCL